MKKEKGSRKKCQGTLKKGEKGESREAYSKGWLTALVDLILNNNGNIYNVVINTDGSTIIYNGSSNEDPRSGENHIWDE